MTPDRKLIGDDEHGWNKTVFSILKVVVTQKQSTFLKKKEPQIYNAIQYGTILENTVVNERGVVDFDDNSYTEKYTSLLINSSH